LAGCQMILRLLALFPCVARLMADVERLNAEKLLLTDHLIQSEADWRMLWDEMKNFRDGERSALHTMLNIEYQRRYGVVPYPDAVHLPPAQASGPSSVRMTPSQAIEAQIDKVISEVQHRMAK